MQEKKAGTKISKKEFKKRIIKIMGKIPEEIKLKNGKVYFGAVFMKGTKYHIYTANGRRIVDPDDLAEVKF